MQSCLQNSWPVGAKVGAVHGDERPDIFVHAVVVRAVFQVLVF